MDDQERRHLTDQLEILDSIVMAHARRTEVMDAVFRAPTTDDARVAIAELLHVSLVGAQVVLDLQLHRFTREEHDALIDRRDEVRLQLQTGST